MKRCLLFALPLPLPLLLAIAACSGGGSGASGPGTPLFLGENDPVPPPRDNPGPGRENPNGPSGGQSSSSSGGQPPAGPCPCAGNYMCTGVAANGGSAPLTVAPSGNTCTWSSTGTPIQLDCNGSVTVQSIQYTSSWSGSSIQLCIAVGDAQAPTCITCTPG